MENGQMKLVNFGRYALFPALFLYRCWWVDLKLMRFCPYYCYQPTPSVLPFLGCCSAGHGPVQMSKRFLNRLEVPYVVSFTSNLFYLTLTSTLSFPGSLL